VVINLGEFCSLFRIDIVVECKVIGWRPCENIPYLLVSFVDQQPNAGLGRLTVHVCSSHTDTHNWQDLSARVISLSQRSLRTLHITYTGEQRPCDPSNQRLQAIDCASTRIVLALGLMAKSINPLKLGTIDLEVWWILNVCVCVCVWYFELNLTNLAPTKFAAANSVW
jgi:hypothetical protein